MFFKANLTVFFPHDMSKTDAAWINQLDINVSLQVLESRLFWGQNVKGQGYEA